jgi:hypothetical protein
VKAAAWNCTPLSHMPFWHGASFYYFCWHCKNMQNLSVYTVWQKSLQIKVLNHDQCIFIIWKIYSNQINNNNIFNKCLSFTRVCGSVWYTESVKFEAFTIQMCNITCDHKSYPNQKMLNMLIYQYSTSHS